MNEYVFSNERKRGLYIDMLMTIRYSHEVWGRVVLRLLEKTHQLNGNLRKNDSFLMPKGEFKLASNPARLGRWRRTRVWRTKHELGPPPSTKLGCPLGPKPNYKVSVFIHFKNLVSIRCGTHAFPQA